MSSPNFHDGDELNENEQPSEASEQEQGQDDQRLAAVPAPPVGPPLTDAQQPGQTPVGPPPGQWVYLATAPAKPASSGLRVAAGVLLILLGIAELVPPWLTSFVLLLGPGTMAAGIVMLCKHRSRGRMAPRVALWLASAGVAAGLFSCTPMVSQGGTGVLLLLLAVPVLILLNKDGDRDKMKPAGDTVPEPTLT